MRYRKWINAQDLDHWAATPQAKSLLPELLRRLVFGTISREYIKKIDFPSGAEVQRPGYDGTTVVIQGSSFVPNGVCFWELGCVVGDPKGKAQRDYDLRIDEHKKRIASGETENLAEATFIAVTAVDWQNAGTWAKDRTKEGYFKEVRAYDSNSLEHWLQDASAVSLWLAQEIHGGREGVIDLAEYWKNLQATLRRPVPPEVLLVNRDDIKMAFANWLSQSTDQLVVKAPSAAELVAVFCAWVMTLLPEQQDAISSRTIIVENRDTWRALATSQQPLILIAAPRLEPDPDIFAEAARKGHHVLRAAEFRAAKTRTELAMMRRFDIQTALEQGGFSELEARQLADAAGGNFTILRRRLARIQDQPPGWANEENLAPLLLAAAWTDDCVGDQHIVSMLTGKKYSDVQTLMSKWRQASDAPVRLVLGTWEFLSPVDAWEALNPFLNITQMDCFAKVTVEVLSEDSPALDLLPNERYLAAVKGKACQFSSSLRRGMAEILALSATRQDESSVGSELHFNFREKASLIVKQILPDGCGWKRWASLGELLSLLMEAAPEVVLGTIERDIRSKDSQIVELLRQELPGVMGAAYHTGVLWALETAAWTEKYMTRVGLCLTQLTKLDPGGQWANRPLASAGSIFFSWRPQTVATIRQRLTALSAICQKEPSGAWKLLLDLIPEYHDSIMDSAKPSYRNWAAGWKPEVSDTDYKLFLSELSKLALTLVEANPVLWPDLIDKIIRLPEDAFDTAITALEKFSLSDAADNLRLAIWEKLQKLVQDHTFYKDAGWALRPNDLARFVIVRDRLAPTDLVKTSAYLFNDDGHMDGDQAESYELKLERRNLERRSKIRMIWEDGGISSVTELAGNVRQPWAVGVSLAQEIGDEAHAYIVPSLLLSNKGPIVQLASGFATNRIHLKGLNWAEVQLAADWLPEQIAAWAVCMPFQPQTWDWIATKGTEIERKYWNQTSTWGFQNIDSSAIERAAKQLQNVRRTWLALELLIVVTHGGKIKFSPDIICDALDAIAANPVEHSTRSMDAFHVQEAFGHLHECPQIDDRRVARLEFEFLPFLGRHSRHLPKTLHKYLASDPDFFVDCLKLLFYPRHATAKEKHDENSEKAVKAQRIWQLFREWQTIPGSNVSGVISLNDLRIWVKAARQKSNDADRLAVCDLTIGELFGRAPEDTDKARPPIAIREIIEECESEEIERGLATGLRNLRGGFSKGLYEGGKQERELAARYQQYADICFKWPRTAAALRSVAESYVEQANREDERAKARD